MLYLVNGVINSAHYNLDSALCHVLESCTLLYNSYTKQCLLQGTYWIHDLATHVGGHKCTALVCCDYKVRQRIEMQCSIK
jgi:hypothetical protein